MSNFSSRSYNHRNYGNHNNIEGEMLLIILMCAIYCLILAAEAAIYVALVVLSAATAALSASALWLSSVALAAKAALAAPALSAAATLVAQVAAVACLAVACVAVVYIGVALVAAFVSRSKGGLWEVYASPEYKNVWHQQCAPSAPAPSAPPPSAPPPSAPPPPSYRQATQQNFHVPSAPPPGYYGPSQDITTHTDLKW